MAPEQQSDIAIADTIVNAVRGIPGVIETCQSVDEGRNGLRVHVHALLYPEVEATGHRLIDTSMSRYEIRFFALRALLVPIIFMLSIAIILFRNDLAVYFWLLVIVAEGADLVYRRIRRRTHVDYHLRVEGDI